MSKPKYKFTKTEKALMCALFKEGKTNKEIAKILKIPRETLNDRLRYNNLTTAIKKNKAVADSKVVRALFERALGYEHPEDKFFCHNGKVIIAPTTKHYPPDTAACFIWLKNRDPENWKDKQEIEHGGEVKSSLELNYADAKAMYDKIKKNGSK